MSSFNSYTSTFDPFGPSTQTPPPNKQQAFQTPIQEPSTQEMNPRYSPNIAIPSLHHHRQHQQKSINALGTYFDRPGLWTYNPDFGTIQHNGTCPTCAQYIKHVWDAMDKKDPSMIHATKSRADDLDTYFMDGFTLGFRQPSGYGRATNNSGIVDQVEIVMRALELCEAENASLRRDLQRTKRQLTDSQEVRRLRGPFTGQTSPTSSYLSSSDSGSMSGASSNADSFRDQYIQVPDFASTKPFPSKPEPHEMYPYQAVNPVNPPREICPLFTDDFPPPSRLTYASREDPSYNLQTPLPAKPADRSLPPTSNNIPNPQHGRLRLRHPRTIAELKELMALASDSTPEGAKALGIVKRVCCDAHNTPREHKNVLQKYALTYWRNPFMTSSTESSTVAKPNPRLTDPVEVWYDYLCTHPHSWPKGVRKCADGKPVMSDLVANRAVAQTRPTESPSLRNEFNNQVAEIFSEPGMYKHLVERNGFVIAPQISFKTFTGSVTAESIAQHFAKCGLTIEDATENFELWAKYWKEC